MLAGELDSELIRRSGAIEQRREGHVDATAEREALPLGQEQHLVLRDDVRAEVGGEGERRRAHERPPSRVEMISGSSR